MSLVFCGLPISLIPILLVSRTIVPAALGFTRRLIHPFLGKRSMHPVCIELSRRLVRPRWASTARLELSPEQQAVISVENIISPSDRSCWIIATFVCHGPADAALIQVASVVQVKPRIAELRRLSSVSSTKRFVSRPAAQRLGNCQVLALEGRWSSMPLQCFMWLRQLLPWRCIAQTVLLGCDPQKCCLNLQRWILLNWGELALIRYPDPV